MKDDTQGNFKITVSPMITHALAIMKVVGSISSDVKY